MGHERAGDDSASARVASDDGAESSWRVLTGWGATAPSRSRVARPHGLDALRAMMARVDERGAIARGLGRSYGAAAQNAGGLVLELADDHGSAVVDPDAGTVTVDGGVSLDALLRGLVPGGWFVPVSPGTRFVTIGGAVAADIHGKNHHVDGGFARHVTRLRLLLADGSVAELAPDRDPALFWATFGGMGLTGIVLEATVRLLPIETSRVSVTTERTGDLDDLCARMSEGDHLHRYSVAWIDLLATGTRLGRGVLTRGDHARRDDLSYADRNTPLAYEPRVRAGAPRWVPGRLLNAASVAAFNEVWFRRAPRSPRRSIEPIARFFHPLDGIRAWNRLYGRGGLVQYQFVVPIGAEATLRRVVEHLAANRCPSFLAVLKRFGASNPGPLSFPMPGWTLALDVATRQRGLASMFSELDRLVLDAGGRHYLAKDAHLHPATIAAGYPRLDEWREVRRRADPGGLWCSDLARRLRLVP